MSDSYSPDQAPSGVASEPRFVAYEAPAETPGVGQFAAGAGAGMAVATKRGLTERNPTTFTAIAVVIGYVILAASTGIVLLGIFPVGLSIRAFKRGEPLAPLALAAAALAVLLALSGISHR